jgi:ParB family chromosome partitioning protein
MKKSALGRGLDALLPEIDISGGQVSDIAITDIDPNPDQPRRDFNEESLGQLADSIREVGVLQPILVQQKKGRYQIIAGERRFRAARLAGHQRIPAIVRDFSAEEKMEAALIENLQREDLNPLEEAQAVRALMDKCGYTQEKAAQRLGKSRPAVANLLRLLTLPEDIKQLVLSGKLSEGHGRVLAGVEGVARKRELAEKTVRQSLSVRQLEQLAAAKPAAIKPPARPQPEFREFEENLLRAFGARTRIKGDLESGKIIISYKNRTELDAIYEAVERLL